ncbi:efflux RND transporter periplasmic adaptor subunit [Ruegeria sp. HU-ET01832]|uniref:HlyD family secretion protein n=1 Tax=Ruegeria sp. HU-ET01832 TaxID=3135906 RepID=UPI00310C5E6D
MSKPKLFAAIIASAMVAGGALAWIATVPKPLVVQGEVEATRIDLAAKIGGRVAAVNVDFGDTVQIGDVVVSLGSPQLQAGLKTAQAAVDVAIANRDLVFATRPEVIDARRAELARAKADQDLAQKTYDRIEKLSETSFASLQRLDEASNTLAAAQRGVDAAQANLELAENGNSIEQKAVAQAQVQEAKAALLRTQTDLEELQIAAPISGQVTARLAEPGELFSAGAILLSIVDIDNAWFTFNLREDLLNGLEIGQELNVRVPALGDLVIPARVTAINAEGSYANWRATKATGDFDLRTFSIRAEPVTRDAALRPGMSALVDWAAR